MIVSLRQRASFVLVHGAERELPAEQAPSEAEAQCAELCRGGAVSYTNYVPIIES